MSKVRIRSLTFVGYLVEILLKREADGLKIVVRGRWRAGREFNLEFGYKHSPTTTFSAGIGAFLPGGFVEARNGGRADTQYWG